MDFAPALEVTGLTHRYGKRVALDNVYMKLPPGKIYGLLGRNGAGKTTLLNIVSASLFASSGRVTLFGMNAFERPAVLSKLCYVREKPMVPPGARLRDVLYGCAQIYPNWDDAYALQVARMFDLDLSKKYKQLSRGMESSLGLVIGLASRAELTVFDEPSLGLDAAAREHFYDELQRDVRANPRTAIVSTHLIDEVTRLFEDVIIINHGRVLRYEPLQTLMGGYIMLTGNRFDVEDLTRGRRVLHTDELGETVRAITEWDGSAPPANVTAEPVPLQRLFVYLTEGGND